MRVRQREIHFICANPWLCMVPLICEDLARPDPVADVIRAVGPNLVIALLMDGPQLSARWPGRYASVLADDPGSSILTVTSLGMALRSVPPGMSPRRTIALWKDAAAGAHEGAVRNGFERHGDLLHGSSPRMSRAASSSFSTRRLVSRDRGRLTWISTSSVRRKRSQRSRS